MFYATQITPITSGVTSVSVCKFYGRAERDLFCSLPPKDPAATRAPITSKQAKSLERQGYATYLILDPSEARDRIEAIA